MAAKACWVEESKADRSEPEAWLRWRTIAQGLAKRARIVLGSANGEGIRELAERLNVSQPTVCMAAALPRVKRRAKSRARSGRHRRISHAQERAVVSSTVLSLS
jgi:hypothetical protein